jgi:hypothetical protein
VISAIDWTEICWMETCWAEICWAEICWAEICWAEICWAKMRLMLWATVLLGGLDCRGIVCLAENRLIDFTEMMNCIEQGIGEGRLTLGIFGPQHG